MEFKSKTFVYLMLLPVMSVVAFIVIYPTIGGIILSFRDYSIYSFGNVRWVGFDKYTEIFTDSTFLGVLKNTLIWIIGSVTFQFLLGFILALLMREPFKGRGIFTGFVFYPWAVSGFAIGLIWSWLLNGQFGIVNDLLLKLGMIKSGINFLSSPNMAMFSVILVNIWYGIPFFAIMILAALQSIPNSLYEAASIDGAGYFTKLFKITIPYIRPTLVSTILLRIIWVMNFPDIIYGMTRGGPGGSTEILSVRMINTVFYESDYSKAAAYGVIMVSILLAYTVMYLRLTSSKEVRL